VFTGLTEALRGYGRSVLNAVVTSHAIAGRPDSAAYMEWVARLSGGARYKQRAHELLQLSPGLRIFDAGCGPGTDLEHLRRGVVPGGLVLGLDRDEQMLVRARTQSSEQSLAAGDLESLPIADEKFDRVLTDRVLQHVSSPRSSLQELRRVCRPGGLAVMCEPDWGALQVESVHSEASDAFARYTVDRVVRNPVIGRQIGRLGIETGWTREDVEVMPIVCTDFETADRLVGLGRNSASAVADGYLQQDQRDAWLAYLVDGPLYVCATLVITCLRN